MISVATDQDMALYKVNDVMTAKIKNVGDVDPPGGVIKPRAIRLDVRDKGGDRLSNCPG